MPSPARSPISFAITRCCAWYSMALESSLATDTLCYPRPHEPRALLPRVPATRRSVPPGVASHSAPAPRCRAHAAQTAQRRLSRRGAGPVHGRHEGPLHVGSSRGASTASGRRPWRPYTRGPGARAEQRSLRLRACSRPTQPCPAWKSAWRLLPPWTRAAELPGPSSRKHRQAALVSQTRASGQPSASLPCGRQLAQRRRTRPCARPSGECAAFHALIWQQQRERVRVGEGERQ
jgi:hypothetical protein